MTLDRLYNYRMLVAEKEQIKRLLEEAEEREEELWVAATSTVGGGDGMPHAKNAGHPDSKLVNFIDLRDRFAGKHKELIELYEQKLREIDEEQLAIERAVDELPVREACVLRARYLEGMLIEQICDEYNFSRSNVYRYIDSGKELFARA